MLNLEPEVNILKQRLEAARIPTDLRMRADRMIARISALEGAASTVMLPEFEYISKYIDWITQVPFQRFTKDNLDLVNAKAVMDRDHYGLMLVKENVLQFLAVKVLQDRKLQESSEDTVPTDIPLATPVEANQTTEHTTIQKPVSLQEIMTEAQNPILCFVGVQGVGKTTMARSIAEALGRKFERIPLGAFSDISELRGRARSAAGAEPGQIVKALIRAGSMNPVILLDEIDKVSDTTGLRADIMAALLEILDPEQNQNFTDRYLDYPVNLSQVLFIATANNLTGVTAALLDRLDTIRFASYSDEEKMVIAKNYLLPKVRKDTGITADQLDFSEDVWPLMIRPLGFDPGIRQLERNLRQLARKVAKMIVEGYNGKVVINPENFRQFFPDEIQVIS